MKLITTIQLGTKEQYIYQILDDGTSSKIGSVEMDNLGDALCGLYSTNHANEIILNGPYEVVNKIKDNIKECNYSLFGNKDINITIYGDK